MANLSEIKETLIKEMHIWACLCEHFQRGLSEAKTHPESVTETESKVKGKSQASASVSFISVDLTGT